MCLISTPEAPKPPARFAQQKQPTDGDTNDAAEFAKSKRRRATATIINQNNSNRSSTGAPTLLGG